MEKSHRYTNLEDFDFKVKSRIKIDDDDFEVINAELEENDKIVEDNVEYLQEEDEICESAVSDMEIAAYFAEKENFLFRDADGFNVTDGRTRHTGIEIDLSAQLSETLFLSAYGTYAEHTYRFDRPVNSTVNGQTRQLILVESFQVFCKA